MIYSNMRSSFSSMNPLWLVENRNDIECAQMLLFGAEGDFVVQHTSSDQQPYMIFIHMNALPEKFHHVGVRTRDGKVHGAIVKRFDNENERMVVQWVSEDGQTHVESVRSKDIKEVNPRVSIRIESVPVESSNGVLSVPSQASQRFSSIQELIEYFQFRGTMSFDVGGETKTLRLSSTSRVWSIDGGLSAAVKADLRIPARLTSHECEQLLSSDGCETGDFVLRLADDRESANFAYAISVLGAIRVMHIGITVKGNNLLACARQPSQQFTTLSELVDFALNTRVDGAILRRTYVPHNDKLNNAEADVCLSRPSILDEPAPWEASLPATPAGSTLTSPALPSLSTPAFSWTSILKSSMQLEIDNIYGDHEISPF